MFQLCNKQVEETSTEGKILLAIEKEATIQALIQRLGGGGDPDKVCVY